VRLLTMTGVGGTGKTRLAQAVARRMLRDFSDGVFFVELAAINDPQLVASTIAQPLGVREAGGKPLVDVLKDYLRGKRMLLVVDNFEQVLAAAPLVAELLAASPHTKILITSRALLHLSVEREFIVPPLAAPSQDLFGTDPPATAGGSDLSGDWQKYEAVRLFVERARSVKPSFALTDENARSVAQICARLDGLPLAIELAAARVKILSPPAILSKLENRLKLLTGGARDLPARQQTMRGAVEWSYDLLTDDEKRLFRRLAVFAGGFTLEAAEEMSVPPAVAGGFSSAIDPPATAGGTDLLTLDLITSLIDKSLLVSKEQANGEYRFRMLEVVREYALESLAAMGEVEAMRRRHAAYFLALGEAAEPHLQAAQSAEWLNRLEEEHDNLRAALQWSLENDTKTAARLAAAIWTLWNLHTHLTEGRRWLKAALESGSLDAPAAVRFKLLDGLGRLARHQGDYATARKAHEEGLAVGRAAGDKRQIALSSRGLGAVAYRQSDFTAAREFFQEGLVISRELNDKSEIAYALNFLGDLAWAEGDDARARLLLEESLAIFRQLGNKETVSANLNSLGAVAHREGDYKAARSHFAEALATARELGDKSANKSASS
ncbi:MAG: tetratricopeptide repeat protein, partial [Acidobacteria bacterium]|nr:tetratricopeptide repeat protein [Acidobacteriota bacterium]